jgi:hypothetical protein
MFNMDLSFLLSYDVFISWMFRNGPKILNVRGRKKKKSNIEDNFTILGLLYVLV